MSLFCKQSLLTWGEILDSFNGKHILKQINTAREILGQKQKRRMVIYVVQNKIDSTFTDRVLLSVYSGDQKI